MPVAQSRTFLAGFLLTVHIINNGWHGTRWCFFSGYLSLWWSLSLKEMVIGFWKLKKFTEKGSESERGLPSPSVTRGPHGCQGEQSCSPQPQGGQVRCSPLHWHCTWATRWIGSACYPSWNLITCLYFSFCKASLQSRWTEGSGWVLAGSTHLLTFGCIRLLKSVVKLHIKMSLWNCSK